MKWSMDHVLTWGFMRDLMLTVDLDRLNVISSGSVFFLFRFYKFIIALYLQ
jgi:hypothetical protein